MDSLCAIALKIRERTTRVVDVLDEHLARIQAHNPDLNALCALSATARADAQRLDAEASAGIFRGPLHGVPLVVKDLIDIAGLPTKVGTVLRQSVAPADTDAPVIARLREHGALILGKTNLDAFAAHISGATSHNGAVCNPWQRHRRHCAGGSSAGTGAAVAAGLAAAGLGSDTGGSCRIPASWCGIVGLRPTQGTTNLHACFPRAAGLDTLSPLARTVADIAVLYNAMQYDVGTAFPQPTSVQPRNVRIGVLQPYASTDLDPDVQAAFESSLALWRTLGAQVRELSSPLATDPRVGESVRTIRAYEFARDVSPLLESPEAACKEHTHIIDEYKMGKTISVQDYAQALAFRRTVQAHGASLFQEVDALCLPVTPMSAPRLSTPWSTFGRGRAFMDFGTLLGTPTLVIPATLNTAGMPIGLQLLGPAHSEAALFALGALYEVTRGPFPTP